MTVSLSGMRTLEKTVGGLKKALESEGHFVELTRINGHYYMKQFNCPISRIAAEFEGICRYELELYRELLDRQVEREQSIIEGAPCCLYKIPVN